jgi:hypothetical protein
VVQPPSQSPITESNVTGLLTDLSLRPTKGPAYTSGRAAMVNDGGSIDSVEGNLSDCVRVDGSSGACIDTNYLPVFVDFETPGGIVDGSNASFTLANTPNPVTSLLLYRNGLLQQAGADYTIQTDGSVLFIAASLPQPGDVLLASYRTGFSLSDMAVAPQGLQSSAPERVQVLCSGSGATTSSPNSVVLGSCTIPASTLSAGDRIEVRFTFAHQGTAVGFKFQVNWGQTAMVQRTAYSQDALVTGHGDASIGSAGTTLDMQTWGTSLALGSVVAPASDAITAPIVVEFATDLSAASPDTVSLQNYTVLRYPSK